MVEVRYLRRYVLKRPKAEFNQEVKGKETFT